MLLMLVHPLVSPALRLSIVARVDRLKPGRLNVLRALRVHSLSEGLVVDAKLSVAQLGNNCPETPV